MPLHYTVYVASMIYVMHYLGLLCGPALSIHSLLAAEVQETRRVNHVVVIDVALWRRHPAL